MQSIWQETKLKSYPSLNKDITTEILVIGGGLCGILCASQLASIHKVVLVEANKISSSRTNKTTAVITALQDLLYKDLIYQKGKEAAKLYLEANLECIRKYEKLSKKYSFDFEKVDSYKYFKNNKSMMEEEYEAIKGLGYPVEIVDDYALCFKDQAQMNPLKLINQLADKIEIYENTKVIKIKKTTAFTEHNSISAKHIIVATGYPFLKIKGLYPLKLTQKKSYVAVIDHMVNKQSFNAVGYESGDLYFRTYKDKLIIGGNDQRTGHDNGGYIPILNHILRHYADYPLLYQWVNQDCVSLDGLPYIGRYDKKYKVYVATGFNLWGMTGAMLATTILTDSIENRNNIYSHLFDPKRKSPLYPILKNTGIAFINLMKPKKRCNHLGCALLYNKDEKVYECPCHGTKYDYAGNIVFNPANKNKK